MIRNLLTVFICLLCGFPSFSQTRSGKLKPLLFQADKNKLQVLPQRFEYSFQDEDRLRIGDVLIDTTQVTFQIEPPSDPKGTYRIHFSWPADLIKDGQLAIKNNSGKAIFTTQLTPENVKITQEGKPQEGTRSEVGHLTVGEIPTQLVDDMKYLPFMVFCIFRESEETRLYLCSKELYVSSQGGGLNIKPRSTTKKTAQVEINGKVVGNQGIIYLNDRSENVVFKAQMQTGAFLEVETRMKDVDFKDILVTPDNEKILITASGAEPVDDKNVQKVSDEEWQMALPKARPMLYLKGDGDIPMRQEFYVRGTLPREKNRVFISSRSLARTYSSTLSFAGLTPEGTEVQVPGPESNATLEKSKKNQFIWTIQDIPLGQMSHHYLAVNSQGQDFVARYDVFRGYPRGLGFSGHYLTPSGMLLASVDFQWWIENFFNTPSPWANFHWGVGFERQQHLADIDKEANANFTTVELLWRAQEGFYHIDDSWGLTLPLQMIEGNGASTIAYGVGGFLSRTPPKKLSSWMNWSELKFQYFLGSSGGDFKLSSAMVFSAAAYRPWNNQWSLRYGFDLNQYKFDPSPGNENMQMGLNVGLFRKF